MRYGKWIGGGLGWILGGPIGALLGFGLGSFFDSGNVSVNYSGGAQTQSGDFMFSVLILSAAVMKADGKVLKSELDYIKKFFLKQFGEEKTKEIMLAFRDILKKDIDIYSVSSQINHYMSPSEKQLLVQYLFGIALADGNLHENEIELIHTISKLIGLSEYEFNSLKAMYITERTSSYKILGIEENATNDEIKKAFRKLAIEYHPDKVTHLGEEFQKEANEKFQKINEAYNKIKKERGIN